MVNQKHQNKAKQNKLCEYCTTVWSSNARDTISGNVDSIRRQTTDIKCGVYYLDQLRRSHYDS